LPPYSQNIYSGLAGPHFGATDDLKIADNSNINFNSLSQLGNKYQAPFNYSSGSTNANSFLAGTQYFQTVEVEVYTSNTFDKLIYSS